MSDKQAGMQSGVQSVTILKATDLTEQMEEFN